MSARREERVRIIKKVIRENVITDQQMLLDMLAQYGIDATQATISRDLRLMGIYKKRDSHQGKSYYKLPDENEKTTYPNPSGKRLVVPSSEFFSNTAQTISRVDEIPAVPKSSQLKKMIISGPFVVLLTEGGYAQLIAKAIDDLHDPNIIATLSGFDTVLLIPSEDATREMLRRSLSRLFPELF